MKAYWQPTAQSKWNVVCLIYLHNIPYLRELIFAKIRKSKEEQALESPGGGFHFLAEEHWRHCKFEGLLVFLTGNLLSGTCSHLLPLATIPLTCFLLNPASSLQILIVVVCVCFCFQTDWPMFLFPFETFLSNVGCRCLHSNQSPPQIHRLYSFALLSRLSSYKNRDHSRITILYIWVAFQTPPCTSRQSNSSLHFSNVPWTHVTFKIKTHCI